jgi:purine-nucleoside phosphorylase
MYKKDTSDQETKEKSVIHMATPHNAANPGDIAETILLPGDPLRAKLIAETYLDDPVQFTGVRNMLGYTGTYKGKPLSVMGTGMGIPSIGIVSHELICEYDVKKLIRVGSCGAYHRRMHIGDVVIAQGACTDSNYAHQYGLPGTYSAIADYDLLSGAVSAARRKDIPHHVGNILSSDLFYSADTDEWLKWKAMNVLGCEMETYALYCEAAYFGASALGIFMVSDNLRTSRHMSAEQRQCNFDKMLSIALDAAFPVPPRTRRQANKK